MHLRGQHTWQGGGEGGGGGEGRLGADRVSATDDNLPTSEREGERERENSFVGGMKVSRM